MSKPEHGVTLASHTCPSLTNRHLCRDNIELHSTIQHGKVHSGDVTKLEVFLSKVNSILLQRAHGFKLQFLFIAQPKKLVNDGLLAHVRILNTTNMVPVCAQHCFQ